jgi:hypothetical protein
LKETSMRLNHRSRRWASILLGLILVANQACVSTRPWRTREKPWDPEQLRKARVVRVHTTDGRSILLARVSLGEDSRGVFLRGTEVDWNLRPLRQIVLYEDQINEVETRRLEALRVAWNVAVGVGAALVIAVVGALSALGSSEECDTPGILDNNRAGQPPRPGSPLDAPCQDSSSSGSQRPRTDGRTLAMPPSASAACAKPAGAD